MCLDALKRISSRIFNAQCGHRVAVLPVVFRVGLLPSLLWDEEEEKSDSKQKAACCRGLNRNCSNIFKSNFSHFK